VLERSGEDGASDVIEDAVEWVTHGLQPDDDLPRPSLRRLSLRPSLVTWATTWATAQRASCTAKLPTPPEAPVTNTLRPTTEPSERTARSAITPPLGER
jgi:hypothetical protein